ncbi:unnamed protein product [Darwinula stevensoni]|nr:unnamed protein product [Darwinula stevensoni]CAG0879262.1 unnamed protein product [Darwinula stevensoni]
MDNGREIPHFLHLPDKLQECVTSKNDQIPCEKCCKLFPTHEITIHQATCGMNSFAPLLPSVLSLVGRTCEILYHSAQGRNHINEDLFPSERDRLWNNFKSNARDSPIDDAIRSRPAAMLPSEILASEARAAESNIQEVEDAQKLHVDCQYCGIEVLLEDLEIHEKWYKLGTLLGAVVDLKDIPRGMHAFELGGGHPYSEGHGGAKPKVHKILPKPEYETLNSGVLKFGGCDMSRQDEGGSNVEMMECEVIPCEFCSQLIPFNDLILHSTGCQPQHFQGTLGDEELHRDFRGYFGSPPSAERYTGTVGSKCPKRSTPLAKTLNTIHDGKAPHGNSKARVSKHNALLVIQPEEPLASLLDISRPLQGHRYQAPGGCDTRSPQQDRENLLEIEELRCLVGNTEAYFRSKSEGEKIQH